MPCEAQPKASRANPGEIRRSLPHGSWRMTPGARVGVVVGAAVAATALVALLPRIAQDPAYHRFADRRTLWGVPHGLDVWSNLAFPLVGLWGLIRVVSAPAGGRDDPFTDPRERWPFAVVCVGVALTGLGSAWYHAAPDNARLVWDRLPMTLVFMGMLSAVVAERVGVTAGLVLLPVFLASGLASIAYWHASEAAGAGDLRPYVLVQFFPALAIPLMLWLFPARYTRGGDIVVVLVIYGAAKIFEVLDGRSFAMGGAVSGHPLKHLMAALACWWLIAGTMARRPRGDCPNRRRRDDRR